MKGLEFLDGDVWYPCFCEDSDAVVKSILRGTEHRTDGCCPTCGRLYSSKEAK